MNREPQIQVFRIAHSDGSYIEVSNLGARWLSWVVSDGKVFRYFVGIPHCVGLFAR